MDSDEEADEEVPAEDEVVDALLELLAEDDKGVEEPQALNTMDAANKALPERNPLRLIERWVALFFW